MLSRSKAPKRSKLAVKDMQQKPVDFFNNTARASTLAFAIIFKIQVPLQKFPFLIRYTIPCLATTTCWGNLPIFQDLLNILDLTFVCRNIDERVSLDNVKKF